MADAEDDLVRNVLNEETAEEAVRNNVVDFISREACRNFMRIFAYASFGIQIFAIFMVVGHYWNRKCDAGLQEYLIYYSIHLTLRFACTIYFHVTNTEPETPLIDTRDAEIGQTEKVFRLLNDVNRMSWVFFVFIGFVLLSECKTCPHEAPGLFYLSLAIVAYNILLMLIPTLTILFFICGLPFLIILAHPLLTFGGIRSSGASNAAISNVPLHKYSPDAEHDYGDGVKIAPIDAKCSICLSVYKMNEDIRILRCKHHFHKSCADDWFRLSGTCPLCIRPISPKPQEI